MEINPFITTISFDQYIIVVKPKIISTLTSYSTAYHKLDIPKRITYFGNDYWIVGFHNNIINKDINCVLINTNTTDKFSQIFIPGNQISIDVEVVLKEELKDISTVEQLKLFKNE